MCSLTFDSFSQELSSEVDKEATKLLEEQLNSKDSEIKQLESELEASKVKAQVSV